MSEKPPAQLILEIARLQGENKSLRADVQSLELDNAFLTERVRECGGSLELRPSGSSGSSSSGPSSEANGSS